MQYWVCCAWTNTHFRKDFLSSNSDDSKLVLLFPKFSIVKVVSDLLRVSVEWFHCHCYEVMFEENRHHRCFVRVCDTEVLFGDVRELLLVVEAVD